MIYSKVKVTDWGNIETGEKFYGLAVRKGRKWLPVHDGKEMTLSSNKIDMEKKKIDLEISLKSRGLM